jgi:hypothetical protein
LNPSTKFQNFLFRKRFKPFWIWKFVEVKISWFKIHYRAKTIFDFRKDFKIFFIKFSFFESIQTFLRVQILSQNSNSFRRISIILDLSPRINFEILFQNIPNLEFKFIWFRCLNQSSHSYIWEGLKLWFEISQIHLNQSKSSSQKFKSIFYHFHLFCPSPLGQPTLPSNFYSQQNSWPTRPLGLAQVHKAFLPPLASTAQLSSPLRPSATAPPAAL